MTGCSGHEKHINFLEDERSLSGIERLSVLIAINIPRLGLSRCRRFKELAGRRVLKLLLLP
jgi:hypothetical protein